MREPRGFVVFGRLPGGATLRKCSTAGSASARRSTSCWRGLATRRVVPWWSAARRASARRRSLTMQRAGPMRAAARHRRAGGVGVRLRVGPSAAAPLAAVDRFAAPAAGACGPGRARDGARRPAGPLPRGAGFPQPAQRGRAGTTAALPARRRPVVRQRVDRRPGVRRTSAVSPTRSPSSSPCATSPERIGSS